jgi:hypothetical protein
LFQPHSTPAAPPAQPLTLPPCTCTARLPSSPQLACQATQTQCTTGKKVTLPQLVDIPAQSPLSEGASLATCSKLALASCQKVVEDPSKNPCGAFLKAGSSNCPAAKFQAIYEAHAATACGRVAGATAAAGVRRADQAAPANATAPANGTAPAAGNATAPPAVRPAPVLPRAPLQPAVNVTPCVACDACKVRPAAPHACLAPPLPTHACLLPAPAASPPPNPTLHPNPPTSPPIQTTECWATCEDSCAGAHPFGKPEDLIQRGDLCLQTGTTEAKGVGHVSSLRAPAAAAEPGGSLLCRPGQCCRTPCRLRAPTVARPLPAADWPILACHLPASSPHPSSPAPTPS